jgi:hypothetical protein
MKNSNDTIGDRNHDLPACSVVPQPTALLRAPQAIKWIPQKANSATCVHTLSEQCRYRTFDVMGKYMLDDL